VCNCLIIITKQCCHVTGFMRGQAILTWVVSDPHKNQSHYRRLRLTSNWRQMIILFCHTLYVGDHIKCLFHRVCKIMILIIWQRVNGSSSWMFYHWPVAEFLQNLSSFESAINLWNVLVKKQRFGLDKQYILHAHRRVRSLLSSQ